MIKRTLTWISIFIAAAGVNALVIWPEGRITLQALDEQNAPMAGASVKVEFFLPGGRGDQEAVYKGTTDKEGLFSASSKTTGDVYFRVKKEGYYESSGRYRFKSKPTKNPLMPFGKRWEPWDPMVAVLLKRIEKPVPMYVRHIDTYIPKIGEVLEFDLEAGDWVKPYGRGIKNDVDFVFEGKYVDFNNFFEKLSIRFKIDGEGLKEVVFDKDKELSAYKFPSKVAPETGYKNELNFLTEKKGRGVWKKQGRVENQNFFLKIRANKERPCYGKIDGTFDFGFIDPNRISLKFTYYLNPSGGRELEFDRKNNLANEGAGYNDRQYLTEP